VNTAEETPRTRSPHPVVWMILYLPFGALGGFVSVALTNEANRHDISISDAALLIGAQMLISWLKWIWAPIVDITLTPRIWYLISTGVSAVGVFTMSAIPLGPNTLAAIVLVIAFATLVNSIVGMAVEAVIARTTEAAQIGRVSAWFQAGNLGGTGLGGGLGLFLMEKLPAPWMSGAIMGLLFMACCIALLFTPNVGRHHSDRTPIGAVKGVFGDLLRMIKTKGGLLAAILCALPVGTGAAQGPLTQDTVAAYWSAGRDEVAWVQGVLAGIITTVGCFVGGYACQRLRPRTAYAVFGLFLAAVATGMAYAPHGAVAYIGWSLVYSFGLGLAYSAFTAFALDAMGHGSGATKYNIFASLSNFPIWWLGLVLARVADKLGPPKMLLTEAWLGVVGVLVFAAAVSFVKDTRLAD
jgi:PAT family beta-lactamase induction signal transducer AmpG